MSGGHGHENHGHGTPGNSILGDGLGLIGGPAEDITNTVRGLFLGLFGGSGGGAHHDHH